jgi:hypothetical protein
MIALSEIPFLKLELSDLRPVCNISNYRGAVAPVKLITITLERSELGRESILPTMSRPYRYASAVWTALLVYFYLPAKNVLGNEMHSRIDVCVAK